MNTTTRTAVRELDELYRDSSPTYDALVARFGRYMPEHAAERVAQHHGATLAELDSELYWSGVVNGAGTTVHVASLLSALGY